MIQVSNNHIDLITDVDVLRANTSRPVSQLLRREPTTTIATSAHTFYTFIVVVLVIGSIVGSVIAHGSKQSEGFASGYEEVSIPQPPTLVTDALIQP